MKVLFLNRSDTTGGAAVASVRLLDALIEQGMDANMLVLEKNGNNRHVHRLSLPKWQKGRSFLSERLEIFARNGFDRSKLFRVSTASYGVDISAHPLLEEADIVHLHWINQGFLSMDTIQRLAKTKRLFWSMHDCWPATGICHLPAECSRFESSCSHCPQINSKRPDDLSSKLFAQKQILNRNRIDYLAVSQWQADLLARSALLAHQSIQVLHNPIDLDLFSPKALPADLQPLFRNVRYPMMMVAARLDDRVKGLDLCIAFLEKAKSLYPDLMQQAKLILVGKLRDKSLLTRFPIAVHQLEQVRDLSQLVALYSASRLLLSCSRVETFGQTLSEAIACATPVLSFDSGGQSDIVIPAVNGYLAPACDTDRMASLLPLAFELSASAAARQRCRDTAYRFSSASIAQRLLSLY